MTLPGEENLEALRLRQAVSSIDSWIWCSISLAQAARAVLHRIPTSMESLVVTNKSVEAHKKPLKGSNKMTVGCKTWMLEGRTSFAEDMSQEADISLVVSMK